MKRLLSLLIGLFMMFSFASAENNNNQNHTEKTKTSQKKMTVSGKIKDANTGEPLTGVKIELKNTNNIVYSDFEGNFQLNEISKGKHQLKLSYISYTDGKIKEITAEPGKKNNITIELESID